MGRNTAPDSNGSDNGCQGGNTPNNGRNPCQSQAGLLKSQGRLLESPWWTPDWPLERPRSQFQTRSQNVPPFAYDSGHDSGAVFSKTLFRRRRRPGCAPDQFLQSRHGFLMFRLMRRHRFLMRCHRLRVTAFIRFHRFLVTAFIRRHRFLVTAFIRRHRLRMALIVGKPLLIQSPGTVLVAAIHGRNTAPDSYGSDNGCQGGNAPTNGRNPCQSQGRLLESHGRNFKFAHRMPLLSPTIPAPSSARRYSAAAEGPDVRRINSFRAAMDSS